MSIANTTNSSVHEQESTVHGESLTELISHATFADAVCLLLRGDRPSVNERALLDAMLVAACTHGSEPPSSIAARTSASSGNPLHGAVAAGMLGMGPRHGCAIESAMRVLLRTDDPVSFVASCRAAGERIPGYGHRLYITEDPRTVALLSRAAALGLSGQFVVRAQAIERALEASAGRRLVLNIDGCIAALLLELRFPPDVGNAIFLTSRTPGLAAQPFAVMSTPRT